MNIHKSSIGPIWRPLKDIYEYYLAHTLYDGRSAAELISSYSEQKRLHRSFHQLANALPRTKPKSDLLVLEQAKTFDEKIEKIRTDIQRQMLVDASNGVWVAMGCRGPDTDHELILPRYWAFLHLNIDQGTVKGEGLSYCDLRCAITSGLPKDDPVQDSLRVQLRPDTAPEKRGPGRPSKMAFVEDLFARRCEAMNFESSLRRECAVLASRFKAAHPDERPIAAHTIANNLRHKYKTAQTARPQTRPKQ
jgi:hypothetical protein